MSDSLSEFADYYLYFVKDLYFERYYLYFVDYYLVNHYLNFYFE